MITVGELEQIFESLARQGYGKSEVYVEFDNELYKFDCLKTFDCLNDKAVKIKCKEI